MSHNERVLKASPQKVWRVLADGWLYPLWVVGATRMREVDASWPNPGAELHHSVGSWPLTLDDRTTVLESRPESSLALRARAWPTGEAEVQVNLLPHGDGTNVTIDEDVGAGAGLLIPRTVRNLLLHWRNEESLRRLAFLAERRQA